MKILVIGNNIGSIKDGIGGYIKSMLGAMKAREDVETVISENGDTFDYGKIGRIFSLKMSNAIIRANRRIKKEHIDTVLVEYPFQEYNPLILPLLSITRRRVKKNGGKMVLSVHEYIRAKSVRKMVVRALIKKADILLVSDEQTKECFKEFHKPTFTRDIPSNIAVKWAEGEQKEVNRNGYVYFGLINSSKAFDEMIAAWKVFNKDGKYELLVLTSSEPVVEDCEKYRISVQRLLSDEEIETIMKNSTYSVMPINNGVTAGSTTFKAAVGAGCVLLGMFDPEYKDEEFVIDIDSYDLDDFVAGFEQTQKFTDEELDRLQKMVIEFSDNFSIEKTVDKIISSIKGA